MKIKQHGNIPTTEPWKLDVTCKTCGALLTLEGPDDMFKQRYIIGMEGFLNVYGDDIYYYFCDECGAVNKVEPEHIRSDVLSKIKYKVYKTSC